MTEKEASGSFTINSEAQENAPITGPSHQSLRRRNNWGNLTFSLSVVLLEIVGIVSVILTGVWTSKYMDGDGFAWSRDHIKQFKYHPLLMVLGLVFLYGNAIIAYRVCADMRKTSLKLAHAIIQMAAFVLSVIALVAVFQYHYYERYPDLYSLHSWIGIVTVALFAMQYVVGFIVYLLPITPTVLRARLMPFHIYFGILLFITSVAACLTGINEKLIFTGNYSALERGSLIANCLGVLLVLFAALVVFIATSSTFKRMPLPEEISISSTYSPQRESNKPDRTSL